MLNQMRQDIFTLYGLIVSFSIYSIVMIPMFIEYMFLVKKEDFASSSYNAVLIVEAATRMA